jgi:ribosomal protein RSM22 (predicted rRNA methylase)
MRFAIRGAFRAKKRFVLHFVMSAPDGRECPIANENGRYFRDQARSFGADRFV